MTEKRFLAIPISRFYLVSFFCALLAACGEGGKPDTASAAKGPPPPPPPEVNVMVVTASSAPLTQELPGRLQARRTAQVRARVDGIVEKRLFNEGSDVAAGTPLFHIDDRTYKAAAISAEADVTVARLTLDRYKRLLEVKAVSRQDYEQAEAKTMQAEAALARAKLDLENANVVAPISGRIGRSLVTEGALADMGEATPLATIEQVDPIYANFTQSNANLLRLRQAEKAGRLKKSTDSRVEIVLDDGSIYPHAGKLLFSDLAVDPNTGAVLMRAEFPNPGRELLPGMFVRIRMAQSVAENTLTVPQRAVQMGPQGQFVMLIDQEGKAAAQPVKIGGMSNGNFVIAEGLKGGERVIVDGLQKARPGSPVKAVEANAVQPASATTKQGG
jgi:membrane fusion protein (multidrug efflux system)